MKTSSINPEDKKFIIETVHKYFPCLQNGTQPLALELLGKLKEDFENSDLVFAIDLVDWNRITEDFRKVILEDCEEWTLHAEY